MRFDECYRERQEKVIKCKRDGPKDSCKESEMGIDPLFHYPYLSSSHQVMSKVVKSSKNHTKFRRNKTMILLKWDPICG